jgi:hypothetical protein
MVAALTKWLKYCDRKYQGRFDMRGQSGAANTRLTTTSPTVNTQQLELKNYDIYRRLSSRTIAILDVSPARILAENSVGRFTISCLALSAYCRGSQRAGITKI